VLPALPAAALLAAHVHSADMPATDVSAAAAVHHLTCDASAGSPPADAGPT
jgi:hypothetical protein